MIQCLNCKNYYDKKKYMTKHNHRALNCVYCREKFITMYISLRDENMKKTNYNCCIIL